MQPPRFSFIAASLLIVLSPVEAATAQDVYPRFERVECDYPAPPTIAREIRRECGYLAVPENRDQPNNRKFRLAVLIYRAQEPSDAPPLLLLHGGPGGAGGTRFPWNGIMQFPFVRHRDVVTFDMRGVSASEPGFCPEFEQEAGAAFLKPSRREWEEGFRAAVSTCVAQIDSMGIDRTAFGADVNARDAIDLRRALGYSSWDIYGVSYGTLVAQELLRLDSPATHAAVLVSGVPPGPVHMADHALARQRNLQAVFDQCAAQPSCQRVFPTLEADFLALYNEFSAKPLAVPVAGGPPRTVTLNGERFMMEVLQGFGQPANVSRFPLLIDELRRGDRDAALRRLIGNGVISPWDPLGHVVQCNEYGAGYRAAVAATIPLLMPAFKGGADDFRQHCDLWLPKPTRQADTRPVVSAVPTLVVHGEFEATDVKAAQQRMTAGLRNAYSYTFPGQGHAGQPIGCYGAVIQQFLEAPARAPDSSCLAMMPGMRFKTTRGYAPTATFLIGGEVGQLTGEWEATLVGGSDLTIQLDGEGSVLRGNVGETMLPIFDGRIEETTIAFKVKSADGSRIISFIGSLRGEQLEFTRSVEILSPNQPGPPGFFAATGPSTVIAKRVR